MKKATHISKNQNQDQNRRNRKGSRNHQQKRNQPNRKKSKNGIVAHTQTGEYYYNRNSRKTGTNRSSYVLNEDLFREKSPRQLRQNGYRYVPFLSNDNNLLDDVFSVINTSPTNARILTQKIKMSMGDGLTAQQKKTRFSTAEAATQQQLQSLESYLDDVSPDGESIEQLMFRIFTDYWSYGNAFIELIKTRVGSFAKLYQRHIPVSKVRFVKKEEWEQKPSKVGISDEWISDVRYPVDLYELPLYPNWTLDQDEDGNSIERSVLHISSYSTQFEYWGTPDWMSSRIWGELEYRIAKYNQSQFKNGFMPSGIATFYGDIDPEKGKDFKRNFLNTFTDTGNDHKFFMSILNSKDQAPDIVLNNAIKEGHFRDLIDIVRKEIVIGHGWSDSMAGISTAGQLGSNQQIRDEYEIILNEEIAPNQAVVLNEWLNPTLKIQEELTGEEFGAMIGIKNTVPLSYVSGIKVDQVLTTNEQREMLGFQPIDEPQNNGE